MEPSKIFGSFTLRELGTMGRLKIPHSKNMCGPTGITNRYHGSIAKYPNKKEKICELKDENRHIGDYLLESLICYSAKMQINNKSKHVLQL